MPNFAENFKKLRLEHNVTQKEIADLLNITPRAVRFYESGDRHPDFVGLIAIADYFDVSLDELVGRDHP